MITTAEGTLHYVYRNPIGTYKLLGDKDTWLTHLLTAHEDKQVRITIEDIEEKPLQLLVHGLYPDMSSEEMEARARKILEAKEDIEVVNETNR